MFTSQVVQKLFLLKSIMKVYRLEKTLSQSDEIKENYEQKYEKQFCKICETLRKYVIPLTHYSLLFLFYTPEKIRKPLCFLMFSWGIEKQQQAIMS